MAVPAMFKCHGRSAHPVDSTCSWVVLVCAFFSNAIILGNWYSFGVFYPALLAEFKHSKGTTALVGSLGYLVGGVLSPFTGRLTDRFGCRTMTVLSYLTCAVSLLSTSFAPNLYLMFLTYSVLYGFAESCLYNTVAVSIKSQFEKRRPLAFGIMAAGVGTGILIMSQVIQALLGTYGLRGTYRVLSIIVAVMCVVGWMVNTRKTDENENRTADDQSEVRCQGQESKIQCQTVLKYVFVNIRVFIYTLSLSVLNIGNYIPLTHMAKYSEGLGVSATKGSQMFLAFGLLSMVGRVSVGKLMDFESVNPQYLYQSASVIGGVTLLLLPLATTHALLMVVSSILGLVDGTTVCAMYVMITQVIACSVPDTRQGQAYGVHFFLFFLFAATGGPLAGFIVDESGSYSLAFYVAGGTEILAALLIFPLIFCKSETLKQTVSRSKLETERLVIVEKVSAL